MKWHKPSLGTRRTIAKFAWLPITLMDSVTVIWLKQYHADQEYSYTLSGIGWHTFMAYDIKDEGPWASMARESGETRQRLRLE